jgi:zinc transport system ATP-binding protein
VLNDINMGIERGSTLGIVGPNGGGKTTLIRLMLGLLKPTRGVIRVDGMLPGQAVRRGDVVGYLPQNPQVVTDMPLSVRQVVRLGLAGKTGLFRSFAHDDLAFADDLLERVGLWDLRDQPVGALSGGQLQRALIARALAPRARLLLLDEPLTGIDVSGQQRFAEFIQALRDDLHLTLVFVSHDLRAVSAVADRIACLNLSLHYHDKPEHVPADVVYRLFACDLDALGIARARSAETVGPQNQEHVDA